MDQVILPNQPVVKKENPFLIVLFELIFILTCLILFFGLLNYFNILRIYQIFPSLSLLPHLTAKSSQTASRLTISPTPTITSQARFAPPQLTDAQINTQQFLQTTLQPKFLPATNTTVLNETINVFHTTWTINTVKLDTQAYFTNSNFSVISLSIVDRSIKNPTLSPTSAANFAHNYLLPQNYGAVTCDTDKDIVCEAFTANNKGKIGYLITTDHNNLFIISCFIPSHSPAYATATSCVL